MARKTLWRTTDSAIAVNRFSTQGKETSWRNRSSLVLIGLSLLLHGTVSSSVWADDDRATEVTPARIRRAAIASFQNSASAFMVHRQMRDISFFPYSTTFISGNWKSHFEQIKLKNVATDSDGNIRPSGKLLSLKNTGAHPGDVVVLDRGTKDPAKPPFVLVYMGEESFKDIGSRSVSFFVYPYLTRLEYNTFPPRFHRQLVKKLAALKLPSLNDDEIKSLPVTTDRRVENAPGEQGTWEWLRKRVGTPPRDS